MAQSIKCKEAVANIFGYAFKALPALLVLSLLASCAVCRDAAIHDAEQYTMRGYHARVATYDLKLDGLMYGAFLWTHHAQAQVYRNGKWYWVCELGGLCDEPTFGVRRMVVLWDVEEYKKRVQLKDTEQPVDYPFRRNGIEYSRTMIR